MKNRNADAALGLLAMIMAMANHPNDVMGVIDDLEEQGFVHKKRCPNCMRIHIGRNLCCSASCSNQLKESQRLERKGIGR